MNSGRDSRLEAKVFLAVILLLVAAMVIKGRYDDYTDKKKSEMIEVQRANTTNNTVSPVEKSEPVSNTPNAYKFQYINNDEVQEEPVDVSANESNIILDENDEPVDDREYTERKVVIDGVEYTIYE